MAAGPLGGHGGTREREIGEPPPLPSASPGFVPRLRRRSPRLGAGSGRALAARPHVCSPCGFIREKEDERGGREERGAPSAFPGFQGSLEPLNEIIGRNGVWRERL